MKGCFWGLFFLLITTNLCIAQTIRVYFNQSGTATRSFMSDDMEAAHASLPLGTRAIISNPENNLEVEVTISGRISASRNRIIELSAPAADFLGISTTAMVNISVMTPISRQRPSQEEETQSLSIEKECISEAQDVLLPVIIPRLPDPNTDIVYDLQIGAFSQETSAFFAVDQLSTAGFDTKIEEVDKTFRVLAINIPAYMVHDAAECLGKIGIKEIWVRP